VDRLVAVELGAGEPGQIELFAGHPREARHQGFLTTESIAQGSYPHNRPTPCPTAAVDAQFRGSGSEPPSANGDDPVNLADGRKHRSRP
jgi:hypothetical protein